MKIREIVDNICLSVLTAFRVPYESEMPTKWSIEFACQGEKAGRWDDYNTYLSSWYATKSSRACNAPKEWLFAFAKAAGVSQRNGLVSYFVCLFCSSILF